LLSVVDLNLSVLSTMILSKAPNTPAPDIDADLFPLLGHLRRLSVAELGCDCSKTRNPLGLTFMT
jgi:hypothetical protein